MGGLSMDKIGDFFDEITPIFEAKNFSEKSEERK